MATDIGKILTYRNRHFLLIPAILLNILPALLASLSDSTELAELMLFTAVTGLVAALLFYLLLRRDETWIKVVAFVAGAAINGWFTALFLEQFNNAYLGVIILVQVIFLMLGPRYGLTMLFFVVLANAVYIVMNHGAVVLESIFSTTVEATVGLMSWVFVSAANEMRYRAEHSSARAQEALAEANRLAAEVTKLNRILLSSQDQERQRLARDIHDGPLQSMGVELLAVERARRLLDAGDHQKAGAELNYLRQLARNTVGDLRDTVSTLRNSLLDTGIEPALHNLARRTREAAGMNVDVRVHLSSEREMSSSLASCIYQVAAEALNNIKKHARAANATVTLDATRAQTLLRISDDGQSFDYRAAVESALDRGHIGLYSMKERVDELGGTMLVDSGPGRGTVLTFTFPVSEGSSDKKRGCI